MGGATIMKKVFLIILLHMPTFTLTSANSLRTLGRIIGPITKKIGYDSVIVSPQNNSDNDSLPQLTVVPNSPLALLLDQQDSNVIKRIGAYCTIQNKNIDSLKTTSLLLNPELRKPKYTVDLKEKIYSLPTQ